MRRGRGPSGFRPIGLALLGVPVGRAGRSAGHRNHRETHGQRTSGGRRRYYRSRGQKLRGDRHSVFQHGETAATLAHSFR